MGKTSKSLRGFAAMPEERRRQIASLGGKIAHKKGVAHEFSPTEAKEAGRKGGKSKKKA
jgi:general stress protein YciG